MPDLPLDHPEPFAATLGVMLYPGLDDLDRRKAKAFSAHYLAKPIQRLYEAGGALSTESLVQIVMDSGERLDDVDKRWWGGTATGQIFKTLYALHNTDEALASWSNAIKIAGRVAAKQNVSGARSALWQERSRYLTVAHFWAAYCLREGRFSANPAVGYDLSIDFQFFLTEAEILRQWGQTWRPKRSKAKPPLPPDVWRTPENWRPPTRKPGWPDTAGRVPAVTVPPDLLSDLMPAGRPKPR